MRPSLRAIVVAVSLLLPGAANADLLVTVQEPAIDFGPAGASFHTHGGFDGISIDGIDQETPWLTSFFGDVTFETGPLLSLDVFDPDDPDERAQSSYEFGGGTFTLTAHWVDQFGNPVQGQYVAPLLSLSIFIRCEQELWAKDCGDSGGGHHSLGDMSVFFGPGEFEPALASILHVHRKGGAFDFDLPLDGIEGNPADNFRAAGSNNGMKDIVIPTAVPEPSVLSLLLLAPVLSRRFRR